MAPMLGSILVSSCIAGIFAQASLRSLQAAELQHVGEDCYLDCWKTPGFCDWCGAGNACCKANDPNAPSMCIGKLFFQQSLHYECVKAAYLPGQEPPAVVAKAKQAVTKQAQCISYMAETGCGWTNDMSCPGQLPKGLSGEADYDDSIGYKCCCTNGLWKEDATRAEPLPPNHGKFSTAQCNDYMSATGCAWTGQYSCPGGQVKGSSGYASDDGSIGYSCCCLNAGWKKSPAAALTTTVPVPIVTDTDVDALTPTLAPTGLTAVPSIAPRVAAGPTTLPATGYDSKAHKQHQDFLYNHQGGNVQITKIEQVDPSFTPTEHHGPIANEFARNDAKAKKERCTFGMICTDLEGEGTSSAAAPLPSTQQGMPVVKQTQNAPKTLPSYSVSVQGSLQKPSLNVEKITGGVATAVAPAANAKAVGSGVVAPAVVASVVVTAAPTVVTQGTVAPQPEVAVATTLAPVAPGTTAAGGATAAPGSTTVAAVSSKSSGSMDSGSIQSGGSSGGYGPLIGVVLSCLVLVCIVAGVAFMTMGRKKKRQTTDREQYLKNDFIERQPVYHEVPGQQETDPMMNGQDAMPPATQEMPVVNQMEPTPSFPIQAQQVEMVVAPTDPSGVSFPGMPPIVGGSMLQPATTSYQYAVPQTMSMSMNQTLPYGNYASPSTYMAAPQMGMTPLTSIPQTGSQFVFR